MRSLYQPNRKRGLGKLVAVTLFVLAVFVFDLASGGVLRGAVRSVTAGIFDGVRGRFSHLTFGASQLVAENAQLREEIASLERGLAGRAVLEAELASLRAMTRLVEREDGISARVASPLAISPYDTFLIWAGTAHGVANGDLVLTGEGEDVYVLGRVLDAGERISLVSFVLSPNAAVEVVVGGVPVPFIGRGNGSAHAEVPDSFPIALGEVGISPAHKGYAVGTVASIVRKSSSATMDMYLTVPVQISGLTHVYVATGN